MLEHYERNKQAKPRRYDHKGLHGGIRAARVKIYYQNQQARHQHEHDKHLVYRKRVAGHFKNFSHVFGGAFLLAAPCVRKHVHYCSPPLVSSGASGAFIPVSAVPSRPFSIDSAIPASSDIPAVFSL